MHKNQMTQAMAIAKSSKPIVFANFFYFGVSIRTESVFLPEISSTK